MPKKLLQRHPIVVVALMCLIIANALVSMKTDGPLGSRITQAMESKAMRGIKKEAEVATTSVQLTWSQWRHGSEHPLTLRTMESSIFAHKRAGDLEGAEVLARRLLTIRLITLGADHWETLSAHEELGHILRGLQDYTSAEKHFRQTLEGRLRTIGERQWATAEAAYYLSDTIARQQTKPEQALTFAELALEGFRHGAFPGLPDSQRRGQERYMSGFIQELQNKVDAKLSSAPIH